MNGIAGKQDAHPGDESLNRETRLKLSRDAHSVGLSEGTMGSGYVRIGIPRRGKWHSLRTCESYAASGRTCKQAILVRHCD